VIKIEVYSGKVIKLGDDIDTDIIIPTQYMTLRTIEEMSRFAFQPLRPEIPEIVERGDILLCGKNFGCGSSREQAPAIIKSLGFSCIIAKSFARIFYRNALNNGIFVIENSELYDLVNEGDKITIDFDKFTIFINGNREIKIGRIPDTFINMIKSGGIVAYWSKVNRDRYGES